MASSFKSVRRLNEEVLRRFPETKRLRGHGDEELPYLIVGYIADWLRTIDSPASDPTIVARVVDFHRWCASRSAGQGAEDDVGTIDRIALVEQLFADDALLPFVPRVLGREELLADRDYFVRWVGADRYEAALAISRRSW